MNSELLLVLGLLVSAVVMFVINKPRMDMVALLMLTVLPFTGTITVAESLAGFADPSIVLIAALFVIGEGLVRTGVSRAVGDLLIAKTGTSEVRLIVLLMVSVCALGSMMSSTAVTAIFVPIALRIAQSTGSSPAKLLLPLCYAALISGMMTLVATAPNLVVSSQLERSGAEGFSFFAFTPFGLPVLVVAIVYMLFARRFLGTQDPKPTTASASGGGAGRRRASLAGWIEDYQLGQREHWLRVMEGSPIIGKPLVELGLRSKDGANVIAIERTGRRATALIEPTASTELRVGDVILLDLCIPAENPVDFAGKMGP